MTINKAPLQSFQPWGNGPGASNVLEYQASGLPYATQSQATVGSTTKIKFPFVTNFFTVKNNSGGTLRVGFTENGVNGTNYFTLPASGSFEGRLRVTQLFFTADGSTSDFEVIAGLTQIQEKRFFVLTGALDYFSGSQQNFGYKGFGYDGIG